MTAGQSLDNQADEDAAYNAGVKDGADDARTPLLAALTNIKGELPDRWHQHERDADEWKAIAEEMANIAERALL